MAEQSVYRVEIFEEGNRAYRYDQGMIHPKGITVNGRKGIEYKYAYEGPPSLIVHFFISDERAVPVSFSTESEETKHPDYETPQQVIETVNQH